MRQFSLSATKTDDLSESAVVKSCKMVGEYRLKSLTQNNLLLEI